MSDQIRSTCGEAERLRRLLEGTLLEAEQAELESHLEGCETCRRAFDLVAAEGRFWDDVRRFAAPGAETTRHPGEPENEEEPIGFLEADDTPGRIGRFGRYEVIDILGRGGMGIVLKAFDRGLHRLVAIKVLSPRLATSASARKRFLREARAAASVAHEHVVTIHAVDEANGLPYLVMHYVAGRSLQERIDRDGPLELEAILRIGMQTAAGLAAAHAQGLVHRDVKPANILLENGIERVKITDFGLARAVDDASLTQSGVVAGTPQYMAPEQARAETVDHRADLFSLGSVLYAMSTGRSPFRAETTVAVLKRVCDDIPRPIREVNASIPEWLTEIVARLHAKDPADRFPSAAATADLLGRHLARLQQPTTVAIPLIDAVAVAPSLPALDPEFEGIPAAKGRDPRRTGRWGWGLAAGIIGLLAGSLALSDAAGVTRVANYLATVLRIPTGAGTLVIEVDDPKVRVELDGEAVVIRGAGLEEVRLHPGSHRLEATRDGKPVFTEIVNIQQGEKRSIRVQLEPAQVKAAPLAKDDVATGMIGIQPESGIIRPQTIARPTDDVAVPGESPARPTEYGPTDWVMGVGTGSVKSVAISPDGRFALSGSGYPSGDATARLWDLVTGREVRRFGGSATGQILGVAIAPDGRRAATCGESPIIRLWDLKSGRELRRLEGHSGSVNAVAFSPDGRHVASAGIADSLIRIWDVETGRELRRLGGHTSKVFCVAYSPDGRYVLSGSEDRTVRLWDAATAREVRRLPGASHYVESVAFSPNGRLAMAGGHDRIAWVWDVRTGREVCRLVGHEGIIASVAFTTDSRRALTVSPNLDRLSGDNAMIIWDLDTGRQIDHWMAPNGAGFWSVAVTPDGHRVVTGSTDGTVRLLKLPDPAMTSTASVKPPSTEMPGEVRILRGHSQWIEAIATPADGRFAMTGGNDLTLRKWDLSTGRETLRLDKHAPTWDLSVSEDGRFMVSASLDHNVHFWDFRSGRGESLKGHDRKVRAVAISHDGRFALSGSEENELRYWDLGQAKELRQFKGQTKGTCSVAISPDGRLGLSGSVDGTARLWDLEKGFWLRVVVEGDPWVSAVAFMPDGQGVLIGRQNGMLGLHAVKDGHEIRRFAGHQDYIRNVQASHDGRLIVSAGSGALRLWDAATGDEVYQLRGVGGGIVCGIILPGNREVLFGCFDTTVRLWRLPASLGGAPKVD